MMKIALYGATGTLGKRILNEALARGHEVTAIVRDPAKVGTQNPNLRVVAGDILSPQNVDERVSGHDTVISAYGPPHETPEKLSEAARSLVAGLQNADVRRLLIVGGAGSLEVAPGVRLFDVPDFPPAWRPIAVGHGDALDVLKNQGSALDWTFLSPAAMIEPGERTGKFRVGGTQLLSDANGESRISAEDFAIAVLDEVEDPRHVRQQFTVAY